MSTNSNKNSNSNHKIKNNLSGDEPEYEPEKWNRVLKDYKVDTKLMDQNEFKKYKKIMAIIQDIHNCYAYSSDYISTKNISTCEKILDKNETVIYTEKVNKISSSMKFYLFKKKFQKKVINVTNLNKVLTHEKNLIT